MTNDPLSETAFRQLLRGDALQHNTEMLGRTNSMVCADGGSSSEEHECVQQSSWQTVGLLETTRWCRYIKGKNKTSKIIWVHPLGAGTSTENTWKFMFSCFNLPFVPDGGTENDSAH